MTTLSSTSNLRSFDTVYRTFAETIHKMDPVRDTDRLLDNVTALAAFAMSHHPGRFADGRIENPLLRVGGALNALCPQPPDCETIGNVSPSRGRHRVLHVASQTTQIGGHTRMIENWVKTDTSSQHSLFITNQLERNLRQELIDAFAEQEGAVVLSRPGQTSLERAQQLRRFAQSHADIVILHHHPHDVVPIVAFATPDLPPIAILNHADHVFWLGSSIADLVINLREVGRQLSSERRATARDFVLPIPLSPEEQFPSRNAARQKLGIPPSALVYLTVGRGLKYTPTSHGNFFATAQTILDRTPGARLVVLGLDAANAGPAMREDPRFIWAGERPNSLEVRAAADVYLESFPFGSQTAALEAARSALPLVLAFAPPTPRLATSIDCLRDIVPPTLTESGYVERAVQLATRPAVRKEQGRHSAAAIAEHHLGEGWGVHLDALYAETSRLSHRPRELPLHCMCDAAEDCSLAQWQFESSGCGESLSEFLLGRAYRLRNQRQYKVAFSALRLNLATGGAIAPSMLAMAKLAPHWLYMRLNRV